MDVLAYKDFKNDIYSGSRSYLSFESHLWYVEHGSLEGFGGYV